MSSSYRRFCSTGDAGYKHNKQVYLQRVKSDGTLSDKVIIADH
jgi:hypothetical protein